MGLYKPFQGKKKIVGTFHAGKCFFHAWFNMTKNVALVA